MEFRKEYIFLLFLVLVFVLRYFSRNLKFNRHYLNLGTFLLAAGILLFNFIQRELYAGILAILMGAMAYGKYFFDINSSDKGK